MCFLKVQTLVQWASRLNLPIPPPKLSCCMLYDFHHQSSLLICKCEVGWIKVFEDSRNLIQFDVEQNTTWNLNNSKLKKLLSDLPFQSSLSGVPAVILSSQDSHLFCASLGNLKNITLALVHLIYWSGNLKMRLSVKGVPCSGFGSMGCSGAGSRKLPERAVVLK